ncbi:RNI-like protein, partial [Imleria badia]
LVPRLFSMLRSSCPTLLSHGFIVLYFLRGPSLVLSSDLPGVQRQTISSIVNNKSLRELHLIGFDKFADTVFASVLPSFPRLRILVLRCGEYGCSKVGTKTAEVTGTACPSLTTLNLNYTSVPPASLLGPLTCCTNLEVLKVAGIQNWTDATFAKLLAGLTQEPGMILLHMKNLKFRQLCLSETSLYAFIALCPNVTRLDVSFTRLHRPPSTVTPPHALEKLSLTSTTLSSTDIVSLISTLPNLRTLYLGALGSVQGSSSSIGNISAMTMTDDTLTSLTAVMANFEHLEKFSLVGNTKLGLTSRHDGHGALADIIRRVGRRCKARPTYLNLSGIPYLRSQDLCGLMSETAHDSPPKLEELALNNTGIDDDAAPCLACCSSLVVLEVAGTKLTSL